MPVAYYYSSPPRHLTIRRVAVWVLAVVALGANEAFSWSLTGESPKSLKPAKSCPRIATFEAGAVQEDDESCFSVLQQQQRRERERERATRYYDGRRSSQWMLTFVAATTFGWTNPIPAAFAEEAIALPTPPPLTTVIVETNTDNSGVAATKTVDESSHSPAVAEVTTAPESATISAEKSSTEATTSDSKDATAVEQNSKDAEAKKVEPTVEQNRKDEEAKKVEPTTTSSQSTESSLSDSTTVTKDSILSSSEQESHDAEGKPSSPADDSQHNDNAAAMEPSTTTTEEKEDKDSQSSSSTSLEDPTSGATVPTESTTPPPTSNSETSTSTHEESSTTKVETSGPKSEQDESTATTLSAAANKGEQASPTESTIASLNQKENHDDIIEQKDERELEEEEFKSHELSEAQIEWLRKH